MTTDTAAELERRLRQEATSVNVYGYLNAVRPAVLIEAADELRRLQQEIERQAKEIECDNRNACEAYDTIARISAEKEALEQEVERLRVDAGRYRWIARNANPVLQFPPSEASGQPWFLSAQTWDSLLDGIPASPQRGAGGGATNVRTLSDGSVRSATTDAAPKADGGG